MPSSMAKFEQAFTALYNLESSPSFPHGHIQLADNDIDFIPFRRGPNYIG